MDIGMEVNSLSVFKSYLRRLLQDLKDIKEEAEKTGDEALLEKIERLILDTQSGIEDD